MDGHINPESHGQFHRNLHLVPIEKNGILDFMYTKSMEGQKYQDQIKFGSKGFEIEDKNWLHIPKIDLEYRFGAYLIFRHIEGLTQIHKVRIGNTDYGTFNYQNGIVLNNHK